MDEIAIVYLEAKFALYELSLYCCKLLLLKHDDVVSLCVLRCIMSTVPDSLKFLELNIV